MGKYEEYLELLGLDEYATEDELKKVYKQEALRVHPDKNPDDPEATAKFQKLTEAYTFLMRGGDDEDDDVDDEFFEEDDFLVSLLNIFAKMKAGKYSSSHHDDPKKSGGARVMFTPFGIFFDDSNLFTTRARTRSYGQSSTGKYRFICEYSSGNSHNKPKGKKAKQAAKQNKAQWVKEPSQKWLRKKMKREWNLNKEYDEPDEEQYYCPYHSSKMSKLANRKDQETETNNNDSDEHDREFAKEENSEMENNKTIKENIKAEDKNKKVPNKKKEEKKPSGLPPPPKKKSKKELQAEQNKRDREMQEIAQRIEEMKIKEAEKQRKKQEKEHLKQQELRNQDIKFHIGDVNKKKETTPTKRKRSEAESTNVTEEKSKSRRKREAKQRKKQMRKDQKEAKEKTTCLQTNDDLTVNKKASQNNPYSVYSSSSSSRGGSVRKNSTSYRSSSGYNSQGFKNNRKPQQSSVYRQSSHSNNSSRVSAGFNNRQPNKTTTDYQSQSNTYLPPSARFVAPRYQRMHEQQSRGPATVGMYGTTNNYQSGATPNQPNIWTDRQSFYNSALPNNQDEEDAMLMAAIRASQLQSDEEQLRQRLQQEERIAEFERAKEIDELIRNSPEAKENESERRRLLAKTMGRHWTEKVGTVQKDNYYKPPIVSTYHKQQRLQDADTESITVDTDDEEWCDAQTELSNNEIISPQDTEITYENNNRKQTIHNPLTSSSIGDSCSSKLLDDIDDSSVDGSVSSSSTFGTSAWSGKNTVIDLPGTKSLSEVEDSFLNNHNAAAAAFEKTHPYHRAAVGKSCGDNNNTTPISHLSASSEHRKLDFINDDTLGEKENKVSGHNYVSSLGRKVLTHSFTGKASNDSGRQYPDFTDEAITVATAKFDSLTVEKSDIKISSKTNNLVEGSNMYLPQFSKESKSEIPHFTKESRSAILNESNPPDKNEQFQSSSIPEQSISYVGNVVNAIDCKKHGYNEYKVSDIFHKNLPAFNGQFTGKDNPKSERHKEDDDDDQECWDSEVDDVANYLPPDPETEESTDESEDSESSSGNSDQTSTSESDGSVETATNHDNKRIRADHVNIHGSGDHMPYHPNSKLGQHPIGTVKPTVVPPAGFGKYMNNEGHGDSATRAAAHGNNSSGRSSPNNQATTGNTGGEGSIPSPQQGFSPDFSNFFPYGGGMFPFSMASQQMMAMNMTAAMHQKAAQQQSAGGSSANTDNNTNQQTTPPPFPAYFPMMPNFVPMFGFPMMHPQVFTGVGVNGASGESGGGTAATTGGATTAGNPAANNGMTNGSPAGNIGGRSASPISGLTNIEKH